jgi:hypothetical protein
MSDTYDEMDDFVARTQRSGGSSARRSDDKYHPQQDFGKFSKMGGKELDENSPEKDHNDAFCQDEDHNSGTGSLRPEP